MFRFSKLFSESDEPERRASRPGAGAGPRPARTDDQAGPSTERQGGSPADDSLASAPADRVRRELDEQMARLSELLDRVESLEFEQAARSTELLSVPPSGGPVPVAQGQTPADDRSPAPTLRPPGPAAETDNATPVGPGQDQTARSGASVADLPDAHPQESHRHEITCDVIVGSGPESQPPSALPSPEIGPAKMAGAGTAVEPESDRTPVAGAELRRSAEADDQPPAGNACRRPTATPGTGIVQDLDVDARLTNDASIEPDVEQRAGQSSSLTAGPEEQSPSSGPKARQPQTDGQDSAVTEPTEEPEGEGGPSAGDDERADGQPPSRVTVRPEPAPVSPAVKPSDQEADPAPPVQPGQSKSEENWALNVLALCGGLLTLAAVLYVISDLAH